MIDRELYEQKFLIKKSKIGVSEKLDEMQKKSSNWLSVLIVAVCRMMHGGPHLHAYRIILTLNLSKAYKQQRV